MAGDWIKMRADLFTHPKVVRISSALKADNLRTVGGLMSVWCLFDAHSIDGKLDGYAPETLDQHLRWPGFAAAMIGVRWLEVDGESLALPEFDTHNGESAKRRAQDADRKRAVRKTSASDADKMRTREEKRREEEKEQKLSSSADAVDPCPHQEIVAAYHRILPELPAVRIWTPARQALLRQRWKEDPERQTVEWWTDLFGFVKKSDFLMGRADTGRPWQADLEWILNARNIVKIIEGKYENRA